MAVRGRTLILAASLVLQGARLCAQHDMSSMSPARPHVAMSSGTSWLPDSSETRAATLMRGAWMFSLHGAAFPMLDRQLTKRGDTQLSLIDWEMVMAMRQAGRGRLELRAMTSLEPFVLGGGGYPELLQTGGTFRHGVIHDRQHPHSALMELAALLELPVGNRGIVSMYGGAVGEPAMGPVAYMHRPSAASDPFAPLGHHWQDAAHVSFGVATLGIGTRTMKLEGSIFNPREADENHPVVDYRGAKLDSYSGRLSWAPSSHAVLSTWWAYLNSHDRLDPESRMHRYGASLLTQTRGPGGGRLASTVIWGMNLHHHGAGSHELLHGDPGASPHHHASSLLAESSLEVGSRTVVFARAERVMKNGEELGFLGGDLTALYDVRSISAGVTRRAGSILQAELAVGARGAVNFVPETLLATYGTRTPFGFAVYLQLQPAGR